MKYKLITILVISLLTFNLSFGQETIGIQADYGNRDFGFSKIKVMDKKIRLLMPRLLMPMEKKRFNEMYPDFNYKECLAYTSPDARINLILYLTGAHLAQRSE